MKALKPSMRENKRYLLIKGKNLKTNVEKAVFEFIGVLGMSKSSLKWIKSGSDSGILSVNRKSLDYVRASISAFPEKISIERVSGTLSGLKK